jgi:membrane protein DedA with SNARE-associated domain
MVLVRAPVYLSIGILRHSYRKFLLFDAFCASAVVGLFFGLSYAFGDKVAKWIHGSEVVLTAVICIAMAGVLVVWWLRRRRDHGAGDPARELGL